MSLKTKVKAGNITNLSDARYCAGMGVDWLGFPSDSIDPKTFAEITGWVTGPQFVLEIGSVSFSESLSHYPVAALQIAYQHLKESESLVNHSLIITMPIADWPSAKSELIKSKDRILNILVTGLTGSQVSDKAVLEEIATQFEILIDLESCPYALNAILSFPISGINISGNQELKPGLKEYTDLAAVLEQLECD
jgi:phosphoribosylanthranilate isomerase